MKKSKIITLLSLFSLAACAKVDSTQVKSGGIYATFSVTEEGNGKAICEAVFQVGSETGTFMALEGGDRVSCEGKSLSKSEVLGMITYSAEVPLDRAKSYGITFSRQDEPEYKAELSLPEPLELTWPRPAERVNGTNGVELRWNLGASTDYDMFAQVTGPNSVTALGKENPDKGTRLIPASSLELPAGSTAENFTATVTRAKAGSFPRGLAGGKSWGKQRRSVTFTVTK